jgi:hypothetical protein
MFGKFLDRLRNATNPFQGFLGELWTIWTRDAGRAVLLARWSWQDLPEDLVQQAAGVQRQAQAAQSASQINQQVNLQLGSMGIFPGSTGPSFGFGMNPDHAIFIMIMGMIRAHRGDPPTSQEATQLAETVLRGQMDPVDAMIATAPLIARQQLVAAAQMMRMTGMYQLLRLQAIIQSASSLPRERIPVLLPGVEHPGIAEFDSGTGEPKVGAGRVKEAKDKESKSGQNSKRTNRKS